MRVEQAAKQLNMSILFLREWIAQTQDHPFGVCVRMPGSSRRTFWVDEEKLKKWRASKQK